MSQFGDFLNDISYGKKYLLTDSNKGDYVPYVINEIFSRYADSLFDAEEMNRRPNIPKETHYRYLMTALRRRKRFKKLIKPKRHPYFKVVQDYYQYNDRKTEDAIKLLTEEQIQKIVDIMSGGGLK